MVTPFFQELKRYGMSVYVNFSKINKDLHLSPFQSKKKNQQPYRPLFISLNKLYPTRDKTMVKHFFQELNLERMTVYVNLF